MYPDARHQARIFVDQSAEPDNTNHFAVSLLRRFLVRPARLDIFGLAALQCRRMCHHPYVVWA